VSRETQCVKADIIEADPIQGSGECHRYARATLDIDIPFVAGVTFEQVWHNRVRDKLGHTLAYFASLDDLIKMKKAAGRPKDLEDLRVLLKLKQRRKPDK
jgi:hypothetical protein